MNTQLKFVDKSLRKSNVLTHNTSQHSFGPGSDVIKTYWLRSVFFTKPIIKLCRIFFLTVFFFSFITFHDNVQNPIHSSQSGEKSSFSDSHRRESLDLPVYKPPDGNICWMQTENTPGDSQRSLSGFPGLFRPPYKISLNSPTMVTRRTQLAQESLVTNQANLNMCFQQCFK